VACSRSASSAIFAFSPASIRRLVFFVIVRSVYQTEPPFSNLTPGPKIRVHFIGVLYSVFLAVEEITKDVYAEVSAATPENAAAFLDNLVAQSPEKIIAVSTEMHSAFTDWRAGFDEDMAAVSPHPFAVACRTRGIIHARSIPPHTKPLKSAPQASKSDSGAGPSNRPVGLH
jgi:hypothetical protein